MEDRNIVLCSNCGGAYRQGQLNCPYCLAENRLEAQRRKKHKLAVYDNEAKQMEKNIVSKVVKTATRVLFIVAAALVVGFLIATIVAAVAGPMVANKEQRQKQAHMDAMDGFLEIGDYVGLSAYLSEEHIGRYDGYDKYIQVAELYQSLEVMRFWKEQLERDQSYRSESDLLEWQKGWCENLIGEAMYCMPESRTYINDRVVLGNEQHLEILCEQVWDELLELKLTREELLELSRERSVEEWDIACTHFGQLIQERFFGTIQ